MEVLSKYESILTKELEMIDPQDSMQEALLHDSKCIMNISQRILEIAKNSTVLRSGNQIGHLTPEPRAYESDGAHTNLMSAITNYALDYIYGWSESPHFTRREINEAVLIHDLPENVLGDIPDNGSRNDIEKHKKEQAYYMDFLQYYEPYDYTFIIHISQILCEMNCKSSTEGRIIYLADKISAIIMMLAYDKMGLRPHANPSEDSLSSVSKTELDYCEKDENGDILLSELWTVDYLYGRKLTQYDDTGFFTALLIMITLLVHDEWYEWREAQYQN